VLSYFCLFAYYNAISTYIASFGKSPTFEQKRKTMAKFKIEVLGDCEAVYDDIIAKNMDTAISLVLTSLLDEQKCKGPLDLIITNKASRPYRVYIRKVQG
jgi:hypothetical protein